MTTADPSLFSFTPVYQSLLSLATSRIYTQELAELGESRGGWAEMGHSKSSWGSLGRCPTAHGVKLLESQMQPSRSVPLMPSDMLICIRSALLPNPQKELYLLLPGEEWVSSCGHVCSWECIPGVHSLFFPSRRDMPSCGARLGLLAREVM